MLRKYCSVRVGIGIWIGAENSIVSFVDFSVSLISVTISNVVDLVVVAAWAAVVVEIRAVEEADLDVAVVATSWAGMKASSATLRSW